MLKRKKLILIIVLIIIAVVSAIIIVYPFVPAIKYYFNPPASEPFVEGPVQSSIEKLPGDSIEELSISELDETPSSEEKLPDNKVIIPDPEINQLIISKIGVQIPIVEGEDETALERGAWRLPQTSTPDKEGNTVLTAHRYKYRPPHKETFYLLDKLAEGDTFQVFWQGKKYNYKIVSSIIVNPDAMEVLNPTENPTITLITCTPLFSTKQRLIVSGELIINQ